MQKANFYKKDGVLMVSIVADANTTVERLARDDDKVKYRKQFAAFEESQKKKPAKKKPAAKKPAKKKPAAKKPAKKAK